MDGVSETSHVWLRGMSGRYIFSGMIMDLWTFGLPRTPITSSLTKVSELRGESLEMNTFAVPVSSSMVSIVCPFLVVEQS